jgi:hypothetical protein
MRCAAQYLGLARPQAAGTDRGSRDVPRRAEMSGMRGGELPVRESAPRSIVRQMFPQNRKGLSTGGAFLVSAVAMDRRWLLHLSPAREVTGSVDNSHHQRPTRGNSDLQSLQIARHFGRSRPDPPLHSCESRVVVSGLDIQSSLHPGGRQAPSRGIASRQGGLLYDRGGGVKGRWPPEARPKSSGQDLGPARLIPSALQTSPSPPPGSPTLCLVDLHSDGPLVPCGSK